MSQGHHVIQKSKSKAGRKASYIVVGLAVLGWGSWALFDYGRYRAGFDNEAAVQQASMLELRIKAQSEEGQRLRERIAILEHGKEIDKKAYDNVADDLKLLQDELHEIKQQLSFYQGIVSPADNKSGAAVQAIKFQRQAGTSTFQYRLILIQGPKRAKRASGRLKVSFLGTLDGKEKTLLLKDLHQGKSMSGKYRFKYFQDFQGVMELPEGFEPQEVVVKLTSAGKKPKVVEERYVWDEVVN